MGQNLFLMSHPDVSLVNILLSITRVSLVQNKCVFCQLRVHFSLTSTTKNYPPPPQGGLGGYLLLKIFRDGMRPHFARMCG